MASHWRQIEIPREVARLPAQYCSTSLLRLSIAVDSGHLPRLCESELKLCSLGWFGLNFEHRSFAAYNFINLASSSLHF